MKIVSNSPAAAPPSLTPRVSDIHDIKPPVEIASGWEWMLWVIGGLLFAAVVVLLVKLWRKRRQQPAFVADIPPHERARRKLEAALDLFEQPKPFCTIVSDAVRLYLEERFELKAPERTTEEFLRELKNSSSLNSMQKESLEQFLAACDLVKFAKYEPGRPELEAIYNSALRLIEETEPKETNSRSTALDATRTTHHEPVNTQ
jgi:hypothetical protein